MSPERHQNRTQSLIPGTIVLDCFAIRAGLDLACCEQQARLLLKEGV
jgi:hypothetical protein